jgi:hypothetical protein
MDELSATLQERGSQYGAFIAQAAIAQTLKRAMRACPNWPKLQSDQREALELIAMKVSRILNGNPDHHDSWHDIAGYAQLVANRVKKPAPETEVD